MPLLAACGLLLVLGVAGVVLWGGSTVNPPDAETSPDGPSSGLAARRYLWYLTLAVVAGVGSGLAVAGAGGRLAMRLLAATGSDAAQGAETEAGEIVGRITVGGTVGFVIFAALFFGLATGVLYLLVRRWLPGGRLGGLTYGVLLLVLAGTRIDPLRADNPDFDIVGPGWVAVAVFGALVLVHGMLVAALAGRYSTVLPLASRDRRALAAHAPLAVMLPAFPVFVLFAVVGAVAVGLSEVRPLVRLLGSPRVLVIGRVVLAGAGLVALPGCVSALVDIAGRPS